MKTFYIKTLKPIDFYWKGYIKYFNTELVEAELIQLVFELYLVEKEKIYYETIKELTIEKALDRLKIMRSSNSYYEFTIRQT